MLRKMVSILLALVLLAACLPAVAEGYSDMLAKAEEYLAAGDLAKALASYQLAQRLQPEEETARLGEANVRILQGDLSVAIPLIDAVLEQNPISPDAWGLKCRADVLSGDISAFETDVVFAEVCGAELTDAYLAAASLYADVGMPEKAAEVLAKADIGAMNAEQQQRYRETLARTGGAEAESADASAGNSALDSAFEEGRLILENAELPAITADAVEIADEVWEAVGEEKPADFDAFISGFLAETTFTWLSLSPSGNSGILTAEGLPGICCYNGKYHIFYPSRTRGVEDTYGNLAKMYSMSYQMLLGREGVVYSPDGRYAVILNCERVLQMAQYYLDPVVIDLSTGEMILTATYANKINQGDMAAVTTAAFSSDGRYLYYMVYGKGTEFRTALYRYDFQEDKTELCYSGSDFHYYPRLFETKDGAFLILQDAIHADETMGITRISFENGVWTGTDRLFDQGIADWRCHELLYSAHSGYAVVSGACSLLGGVDYAFQRIRPEEDFAGLNRYYGISKEDGRVLAMTADEISAQLDSWTNRLKDSGKSVSTVYHEAPVQFILKTALSPDGRYALMLTLDYGTNENPTTSRHLYLVRLDDLSVREVSGIDPIDIRVGDMSVNFRPVIEWNTDTLLIGTKDGVQAYRFQP